MNSHEKVLGRNKIRYCKVTINIPTTKTTMCAVVTAPSVTQSQRKKPEAGEAWQDVWQLLEAASENLVHV